MSAGFANLTILCVSAITFVIGFARLNMNSIWLDEAYSLSYAGADNVTFWRSLHTSDGPVALYYIILRSWFRLFPESAANGRLLSLIAATAAIPATYLLGRRMFSTGVGVLAATLLALNSSWWLRAEDVRVYSISMLASTCASLLFVNAIDSDRPEPVISAFGGLLNGLSFVLQFAVAGLAIIAQFASLAFIQRSPSRFRNAAAIFGTTAVVIVCAGIVFSHLGGATSSSGVALPSEIWFNISQLTGRVAALVGLAVASGFAIMHGIRKKERFVAITLAWCVLPPVVAAAVFLVLHEPVFVDRYLISSLVPLLLLASYGLLKASPATIALPLAVLVIFGEVYGEVRNDDRSREDWRVATRVLMDHVRTGDVVVAYPEEAVVPLVEQMRLLHAAFPAGVEVIPSDSQNRWWVRPADLEQYLNTKFDPNKAVWVVVRRAELWPPRDGFKQLLDPKSYYIKMQVRPFGLLVLEYVHR